MRWREGILTLKQPLISFDISKWLLTLHVRLEEYVDAQFRLLVVFDCVHIVSRNCWLSVPNGTEGSMYTLAMEGCVQAMVKM